MSPFRCPSGHRVQLAFGDEQVRLPCPMCGIDVYRFRDAVMEEDAPGMPDTSERSGPDMPRMSLKVKHLPVAIGSIVVIVAGVLFAWHRPVAPSTAASRGPVIPVNAVPGPGPANLPAVSITNFSATPTGSGVVKVSFRLTNANHVPSDYPGLTVHWHGVPDADQRIGKDAYAHPPPPFTSTDVKLELARPQGATGIDVNIND